MNFLKKTDLKIFNSSVLYIWNGNGKNTSSRKAAKNLVKCESGRRL